MTMTADAAALAHYAPVAPTIHVPPTKVADGTYVIHQVQEALGQPLFVYLNSMVIQGDHPVIVDTGTPGNRQQWMEDVFSLVAPQDVEWVFISHDDVDHTGNLEHVMAMCPKATLVCNWAMVERHSNCFEFPLERCRWVMHGESFDIGDRTLRAVRPPVWDSPTTRGLYDPRTGVYWAVDSFATPLPDPMVGVADLDPEFWQFGMTLFAFGAVAPWLAMLDPVKFAAYVEPIQALDITTVAACHTPVLEGPFIQQAFDIVKAFPTVEPPPLPDQSVLDQVIAATATPQ